MKGEFFFSVSSAGDIWRADYLGADISRVFSLPTVLVICDIDGEVPVFSMAFAFIGIDIILRIIVIEKKTARLYADGPSEEEVPQQSEQAAPEDAASRSWTEKLPPIITMLRHPRLLNALWATLMQAVFSTSFETTVSDTMCSRNQVAHAHQVPLYVKENFGFGSTGAGHVGSRSCGATSY
jgi:hypothetical protein